MFTFISTMNTKNEPPKPEDKNYDCNLCQLKQPFPYYFRCMHSLMAALHQELLHVWCFAQGHFDTHNEEFNPHRSRAKR